MDVAKKPASTSKLKGRQQHTSFSGVCAVGLSASQPARNRFFTCVRGVNSPGFRYCLHRASVDKRLKATAPEMKANYNTDVFRSCTWGFASAIFHVLTFW